MKKSSKKPPQDHQVNTFEKEDLGIAVRTSRSAIKVTKSHPTSILLPTFLVEKLKEKGKKRGIGYQTMLKIILSEQVDRY